MEFLNKLVQHVLSLIATMGWLLIAPLLYILPVIFVLISPAHDIFDLLAGFQLATGPFVSAFWTIIVLGLRKSRREIKEYGVNVSVGEATVLGLGYALYGFFGTLVAEVVFFVMVGGTPRVDNVLGWALWFAAMPFVIFAPVLLVSVKGEAGQRAMRGEIGLTHRLAGNGTLSSRRNNGRHRDAGGAACTRHA